MEATSQGFLFHTMYSVCSMCKFRIVCYLGGREYIQFLLLCLSAQMSILSILHSTLAVRQLNFMIQLQQYSYLLPHLRLHFFIPYKKGNKTPNFIRMQSLCCQGDGFGAHTMGMRTSKCALIPRKSSSVLPYPSTLLETVKSCQTLQLYMRWLTVSQLLFIAMGK